MANSTGPMRAIVFLILAFVASGAALVVVWKLVQQYQTQVDSVSNEEEVVLSIVAARTLYQGLTITEEDLVAVQIPAAYHPANGFTNHQQVVGQLPRERILANEFVRSERLASRQAGTGLNALISRGMRAISMDISNGAALSGFLDPGNYVDVMVTITPEKEDPETRTLLQAVYVLAVHGRTQDVEGARARRAAAPSVTLQVTPEQAEQLAHARRQGQIFLLLRNDLDLQVNPTEGVTLKTLLGTPDKPVVKPTRKPPAAPKTKLLIYKGATPREYEWDK